MQAHRDIHGLFIYLIWNIRINSLYQVSCILKFSWRNRLQWD